MRITGYLPIPARLKQVGVQLVRRFAEGLQVFEQPGPLIRAALISLAVWLVVAGMFWATLASFHMPPSTTTLSAVLFLTALVNLGLLIPAMPGNVGTYEGLIVSTSCCCCRRWTRTCASPSRSSSTSANLVTTLIVGTVAFWTQHISLREVQAGQQGGDHRPAGAGPASPADGELGIERL